MLSLKLAWRYLNSGGKFLNFTSILALIGMVIGVASLVVSMAVVSGYETTLKKTLIDVVGHLIVVKRGKSIEGENEVLTQIKPMVEGYVEHTPFVVIEAVMAHNKKVGGVILEGVEPQTVSKVLSLKKRILEGQFNLGFKDDYPNALIGKGLAKKFNIKIGDTFRVVMPQSTGYNREQFRPRSQKFNLVGILDLGRYDYDTRYILTSLSAAQDFAEINNQITGVRIRVKKDEQAIVAEQKIKNDTESPYWARSWKGANANLFEAIKYEKPVIFFVVFIIVIAAGFNISSTLFVSVMKRFSDIGVLKALGAKSSFMMKIFTWQGLLIGMIGSLLGIILGLALCWLLMWGQDKFGFLPAEVYKIARIQLEIRPMDLVFILLISTLVCFLSTLAPAIKGARLNPVEGLRYE
ncbi:MAG: ABC transporter permease [Bdellovibrionales bacterium]|nr:ABC transporter permease [Bdellovibrionales bacterium]